ncbi:flagellar hook-length control protein FliK [Paeniglutamicibacter psychrophenolicus]|uniref:flagellar hook-length control protein FliK n=1 Tax=Paeniglutamicibacter psychrophenolicus TaxID=257454 RepID=UPI00277D55F8|nr:flagellar hook-length control protein FliK [Paeniglutamicibacter psychrophenolicus]MDQ0094638.1 flagellar hook-length control protein FliK [Paeniglutamicibacter psychrophenolicus]
MAQAPLLVIGMPEPADSVAASQDASQTPPGAMLTAAASGMAPVQGVAAASIRPEVPGTGADTAGLPISAAEGAVAESVPAPAAAGVIPLQATPPAVPLAPVPQPTIPAHAVGQALNSGPTADAGVAAVDSIEVPSATAAPVRTQPPLPLHRQLLGPIATLAAGPHGERTLSVNIAPEALGPITVKAHLGSEGIRMEISAPTEAGREALRAMLPELRRELAAGGGGNITLNTTADGSSTGGSPRGEAFGGGGEQRAAPGPRATVLPGGTGHPPEFQAQPELSTHRAASHLDVMA